MIQKTKIELFKGNITDLEVDAIVNAANDRLIRGGGVDNAIHEAAGPELQAECNTLNGCATGDAKIANGYNSKAKYIILAVGPIYNGGLYDEDKLLASCYRRCLEIAIEYKIKTIAFPCISTGVYKFPAERAAEIAFKTIKDFIQKNDGIEKIIFVCFGDENYEIYSKIIAY